MTAPTDASDQQTTLRDELSLIVLRAVREREGLGLIEAAIACMGCAAIVLGALPPAARERAASEMEGKLLEHANRRASEIRSGEFDRRFGN